MKQHYTMQFANFKKGIGLLAILLATFFTSTGQYYYANLSGPAEEPPNASPGTGKASVTITGTLMRVQATFSGLLGNVTAAHIHGPTAVAGSGNAAVATTTPTFTGFPSGVTSGMYDHTFDMLLASSYRSGFITANGGTPESAFEAFKLALANGTAYFNIHSNLFPGGEIRGFLMTCPTINVTIPDAYALPAGTLPNTVYPAYAPASSLNLSTMVSGGTSPYTYTWSNGATSSWTTVSPTSTTNYTVTVTDQNGCTGMASKTINVVDISGGNNGDKIVLCHKQNSLTVAASAVPAHLEHGDMLGACAMDKNSKMRMAAPQETKTPFVRVMSNPSRSHFDLQVAGRQNEDVSLRVYDMMGRVMETKTAIRGNQVVRIGASFKPGMYVAEASRGAEKQTIRLVKAE